MASYQSFFDCPSILRKIANVFLIYKPNSKVELVSIANRIGMDADDLKDLFKQFCSGYYDFIMIDKTKNTPYPVRKNIYTIIDYESEDEEKWITRRSQFHLLTHPLTRVVAAEP